MKQLYYTLLLCFLFLSCSTGISQTVYIPKKGKKDYHKKECKSLTKKSKEIKFYRALSLGYKPCEICKPTSENAKDEVLIDHSISPKKEYKKKKRYKSPTSSKDSYSAQCSGRTKSGRRCLRKTKSSSGRCWQH